MILWTIPLKMFLAIFPTLQLSCTITSIMLLCPMSLSSCFELLMWCNILFLFYFIRRCSFQLSFTFTFDFPFPSLLIFSLMLIQSGPCLYNFDKLLRITTLTYACSPVPALFCHHLIYNSLFLPSNSSMCLLSQKSARHNAIHLTHRENICSLPSCKSCLIPSSYKLYYVS